MPCGESNSLQHELATKDLTPIQTCVDSAKYAEQGKASMAEGTKIGVRGTPSFLLGLTEADGTVKTTTIIRGAQPYPVFQQQINALLAPSKPAKEPQAGTDG